MRLALSCDCTDIEAFLGQYSHFGAPVKDLSRFGALCERLGNPQDKLRFIHIAGTNGKGSTAEYCASALAAAGYTAGKFTSPYVTSVCERIAVSSPRGCSEISCADFARLSSIVADAAEKCGSLEFSQFEILNAAAFLYYAEIQADYVVLEAGIGGTLDSTNIIKRPEAAVITSIGLDHTKILGDTEEKIAKSKCGIIKGGFAVAAAGISDEAMSVIWNQCELTGARLSVPDLDALEVISGSTGLTGSTGLSGSTGLPGSRFVYKGEEYRVRMGGGYQVQNALTAIEALSGIGIEKKYIRRGLENAVIPARMELLGVSTGLSGSPVLIDGGHNPQAAKAVRAALEAAKLPCPAAVIGMMNTKDYRTFLEIILPCFELVVFCDNFAEGCVQAEELKRAAGEKYAAAPVFHDAAEALAFARSCSRGKTIFCGGSFYFAAAVRRLAAGDSAR